MEPEKACRLLPGPVFTPYYQDPQDRSVIAHDRLFLRDRMSAFPLAAVFLDALPVIFLKCRGA